MITFPSLKGQERKGTIQELKSALCGWEFLAYNARQSYLLEKVLVYLHAKQHHLLASGWLTNNSTARERKKRQSSLFQRESEQDRQGLSQIQTSWPHHYKMECPASPNISKEIIFAFSETRIIARKLDSASKRRDEGEGKDNICLNLENLHYTTLSKDGKNKM